MIFIFIILAPQTTGIPGFGKSGKMCQPKKIYKPPDLPRNFKPIHVHASQKVAPPTDESNHQDKPKRLNASERSEILGETPHFSEYSQYNRVLVFSDSILAEPVERLPGLTP